MNNSIVHRGPDSGDIYITNNLALGHRRLSIIDLRDVANQPMHSSNKMWSIVFNGEIYNFNEIKSQLSYNFKTRSDTEVILAAVQEKGINWFLKQANGMFAIALYNHQTEELSLIRDRLGIKPLYYYFDGKKIIFSSEIKAILNSGLVEAVFNENAVDEYLANRYVRAPYTFFKGIKQVTPGTILTCTKEFSLIETQYWEVPTTFLMESPQKESDLLPLFEEAFIKSINYRLITDVPLGAYLSGGVDSSLITAVIAGLKKEKINTYTIGFDELNEFSYSKIIADKYNTQHHEILLKKEDYLTSWEKLIQFKDAPLGVPNEIPLAIMSSKLKEKITVVLSGEGADELMGGYGRIYRLPFTYENLEKKPDFYSMFIEEYEYVPRTLRDKLINTPKPYRKIFDEAIKEKQKDMTNEHKVFHFFHSYHVTGLLQRVDATTMQASVEARVPFLDHQLIEFCYKKIPYNLKLKWNNKQAINEAKKRSPSSYSEVLDTPKYLLREMGKKYLPNEIITRKKVGFPVPLNQWFDNLEIMARELLMTSTWLKKDMLNQLIIDSRKQQRAGQILWMFINIELFKNNYFNKEWKW